MKCRYLVGAELQQSLKRKRNIRTCIDIVAVALVAEKLNNGI
jgi:hypothetical protein